MVRNQTTSEIAASLGVASATIQKYAREEKIPYDETPGGHRRFDLQEVRLALSLESEEPVREGTKATAVILTAIDVEYDAVVRHLKDRGTIRGSSGTRYQVGHVSGDLIDWKIAVAEIGPGNHTAAIETTRAIEAWDPAIVLFVGVAGGLKELERGTVVVATKVYSYHSGKEADDFLSRPIVFPTWSGLEQLAMEVRRSKWVDRDDVPQVELKPIAAGDVLVGTSDSITVERLRLHFNDAVAVDMESAGVYAAAFRSGGVACLAVRGISDRLDNKTADADNVWQPIAAENAAAFAIALLRSADPEDVALRLAISPYSSEVDQLLSSLPPPSAAVFRSEVPIDTDIVRVLRILDSESPQDAIDGAFTDLEGWARVNAGPIWRALGEFASAHGLTFSAEKAFTRAAGLGDQVGRSLARAAIAAKASGSDKRADALIRKATDSAAAEAVPFVSVARAVITENADSIVAAYESSGVDDPLATLYYAMALEQTGREDEAIAVAEGAVRDHPVLGYSAGASTQLARLLLGRAEDHRLSRSSLADVERARELALQARDGRRSWGGPSAEPAYLAIAAAMQADDAGAAQRYALLPPDGDAIEVEAHDPLVAASGAYAALAVGEIDRAIEIGAAVTDRAEKRLIEAACMLESGGSADEAVRIFREAAEHAGSQEQRLRALLGLARTGTWPIPELDEADKIDDDNIALVTAVSELTRGMTTQAIRRLRTLPTLPALAQLIDALVREGEVEEAVAALNDGAARFNRPGLRAHAAFLLANAGRFEEAAQAAEAVLASVPAKSYVHGQMRQLTIEMLGRTMDWQPMVDHARAALSEGLEPDASRWSLVFALFNQGNLDAARQELLAERALAPRNEAEAHLAIQLMRTGGAGAEALARILDIADRYASSEELTAAALGAVLLISSSADVGDDVGARIRGLGESFFTSFPESGLIKKIDVTNMDNLADFMRESFGANAEAYARLVGEVQEGRMPYGLPAVARGRAISEAIASMQFGPIPIGTEDPESQALEEAAARRAVDGDVVVDTTTIRVLDALGTPGGQLRGRFRLLVADATLADCVQGTEALRVLSVGTMGWNHHTERPVLVEIPEHVAQQHSETAASLLNFARSLDVRRVDREALWHGPPSERGLLAPVELALERGVPLWADDPALRAVARSEGVPAFGTTALMESLLVDQEMSPEEFRELVAALYRAQIVDVPFLPDVVKQVADEEGWRSGAVITTLTRRATWTRPQEALDLYHLGLEKAAVVDPEAIADWSYAASIAVARGGGVPNPLGAVARIVLSGMFHLGGNPEVLPHLLQGGRAAAHQTGLDDPLPVVASVLRDAFVETFGAANGAQLFAVVVGDLDDPDRATALTELLG